MADHKERDAEVCSLYISGLSMKALCARAKLSRMSVYQILKKAGVQLRGRTSERSERDEFLGVNVSEPVKSALREEAKRRGLSVSELTSDTLKDMLVACGHSPDNH